MAKALLGHVGLAADPRLAADAARLRRQVAALSVEIDRLQDDNAALREQVHDLQLQQEMLTLSAERHLDVDETSPLLSRA